MKKYIKIIAISIIAILIINWLVIPSFARTDKVTIKPAEKINISVENSTKNVEKNIFIIGDSRSVGMEKIDKNISHFYTAEVGQGYNFLNKNYKDVLQKMSENDILVINLGINDLYNIEKYIDLINSIEINNKIYVVSVNPVDEQKELEYGYNIKNEDIISFNKSLKNKLNTSICFIDTYSVLKENSFDTLDGIHYTDETYISILDQIENNTQT